MTPLGWGIGQPQNIIILDANYLWPAAITYTALLAAGPFCSLSLQII